MANKKRSTTSDKDGGFSLDPLRGKLEKGGQLAGWIEAASAHAAEFPPDVVRTVVADYMTQYDSLSAELGSLCSQADAERERLAKEAAGLEETARSVEAQVDEYKLRHVIGELTQAEFEKREGEARAGFDAERLDATREAIEEIEECLSAVAAVRERITGAAGVVPEPTPPAEVTPGPAAPAPVSVVDDPSESPFDEVEEPAPPPEDELGEEAYQAGGEVQDEWDVEPPPPGPETDESAPAAPGPTSSWGEHESDAPAVTATAGEDLMATGVIQAQPGIGEVPPPVHNTAEFAGQIEAPPPGDGPRLAVTPPDGDQVIYPFNGDVMSLGRGRNNDIQIKNDGKISRYHCRIFRRGDEFIVEDNKSSNGTLVDGKLVTRQRLEGGEVVQLGETRVQFFMS